MRNIRTDLRPLKPTQNFQFIEKVLKTWNFFQEIATHSSKMVKWTKIVWPLKVKKYELENFTQFNIIKEEQETLILPRLTIESTSRACNLIYYEQINRKEKKFRQKQSKSK